MFSAPLSIRVRAPIISDGVSRRLKREKNDRCLSEVTADNLNGSSEIADVTGHGIHGAETPGDVADETERSSGGTLKRVTADTL